MTNPNDEEWWNDEKYWTELNQPDYAKVVAEAERRTWEEARVVIADVMDCSDDTVGYYEDALQKKIDAKLASLANDKV